jgi:hypothetical protein
MLRTLHPEINKQKYGAYRPHEHPHTSRCTTLHGETDANITLYARYGKGRGEERGRKANQDD